MEFTRGQYIGDDVVIKLSKSDNLNKAKKIIDRFIEKDNKKSRNRIVSKEVVDI